MKTILQCCSFFHSFAEEEPDMEFIDMSVIDGGLTYILGKQSKTGEFPVTGPVHNYELLVSRLSDTSHRKLCGSYIIPNSQC